MSRDTMHEDINDLADEPDLRAGVDFPNKGRGFDLQQQGHNALQSGRIGQWAAGLWFASHGLTTTFGAEGSKHDLFVENPVTNRIQSVQVKTTQPQKRTWDERRLHGKTPRYQWRLKASPAQRESKRGNWDAAQSDRLVCVAFNLERGMLWIFDSELHDLRDWKTQIGIKMLQSNVESEPPFLTLAPGTCKMQTHVRIEVPMEPTLFEPLP